MTRTQRIRRAKRQRWEARRFRREWIWLAWPDSRTWQKISAYTALIRKRAELAKRKEGTER